MSISTFFNSGVFASMLRVSTPLILAALGCLFCERAGVNNLAMEGFMLVGAFSSIAMIIWSGGNPWLGMLGGIIGGALLSVIFGLAVINFRSNHIISSIAVNMLGAGLTAFLMRAIFSSQGTLRPTVNNKIPLIQITLIDKIPIIGPAISSQSFVVYLSVLFVIISYIVLNRTEYGLNVRSVGESENAAKTAGINPNKIRWSVILLSGALSGLAGSFLSSQIVSEFTENMINGRGFSAYTSVVFGNSNPIGVWLATMLFGYADAIGIQIELLGTAIPPAAVKMLPYLLAILALVVNSIAKKYKGNNKKAVKTKEART